MGGVNEETTSANKKLLLVSGANERAGKVSTDL